MKPRTPLPRGWRRHTKAAIVQILALSHYAFTAMLARGANSRRRATRLRAERDRLEHELALLQEEMRLKDGYTPLERTAIMELRAARGWSARQAARRLHVTMTTLASWKARMDGGGPKALLQTMEPVNKFPDLVRYIVRRLKVLCPLRRSFKPRRRLATRPGVDVHF